MTLDYKKELLLFLAHSWLAPATAMDTLVLIMGDANFKIFKSDKGDNQTFTEILPLSMEDKKQEIIRLVGGTGNSLSACQLAEELIENSQKFKNSLQ